jgi:hypothetical protein
MFAGLIVSFSTLVAAPANAQNQNMEVIHHPERLELTFGKYPIRASDRPEAFGGVVTR